jgi:hypothetical protein
VNADTDNNRDESDYQPPICASQDICHFFSLGKDPLILNQLVQEREFQDRSMSQLRTGQEPDKEHSPLAPCCIASFHSLRPSAATTSMKWISDKTLFFESFNSALGQRGKFCQRLIVNRREIETRFALHPFLERGRDTLEQIGKGVDGHQVKTDVTLLDLRRTKKDAPFEVFRVSRVEIVPVRLVRRHGQILGVLLQYLFQTRKRRAEICHLFTLALAGTWLWRSAPQSCQGLAFVIQPKNSITSRLNRSAASMGGK